MSAKIKKLKCGCEIVRYVDPHTGALIRERSYCSKHGAENEKPEDDGQCNWSDPGEASTKMITGEAVGE